MAIDTRQKRAAVLGVARPWYRNSQPAAINHNKRAAIGNAYIVPFFEPLITAPSKADFELRSGAKRLVLWVS